MPSKFRKVSSSLAASVFHCLGRASVACPRSWAWAASRAALLSLALSPVGHSTYAVAQEQSLRDAVDPRTLPHRRRHVRRARDDHMAQEEWRFRYVQSHAAHRARIRTLQLTSVVRARLPPQSRSSCSGSATSAPTVASRSSRLWARKAAADDDADGDS